MTAMVRRLQYDSGPCLHCEHPEADHLVAGVTDNCTVTVPPVYRQRGPETRCPCPGYTATGRMITTEARP